MKKITAKVATGYLTLIATMISQIIAARFLGAENFGLYILSLSIISIFEVTIIARSSDITIRALSENNKTNGQKLEFNVKNIFRTDWIVSSIVWFIVFTCSFLISKFSNYNNQILIIVSFSILAHIGYGIRKSFLLMEESRRLESFELTWTFFSTILTISAAIKGNVSILAFTYVANSLLKNIICHWYVRNILIKNSQSNIYYKEKLNDNIYAIIKSFINTANLQADLIVVSYVTTMNDVGIYKIAKTLSSIPLKIAFPFWRYHAPEIIKAASTNKIDELKVKINKTAIMLMGIFIVIIIPIGLFIDDLIIKLYGNDYLYAGTIFLILIVGSAFTESFGGWYRSWIITSIKQKQNIMMQLIGLIGIIVFGLFIGEYGLYYIALTVSLVQIAIVLISNYLNMK